MLMAYYPTLNTPIYSLPLLPQRGVKASEGQVGSDVGQWAGQCCSSLGQCPDGCLVMSITVGQISALTFGGFAPTKGSDSE